MFYWCINVENYPHASHSNAIVCFFLLLFWLILTGSIVLVFSLRMHRHTLHFM